MSRKALKQAAGSEHQSLRPRARPRTDEALAPARPMATVRIMAPKTSHAGGVFSSAPAGQARRAPPTSPPSMRIASGQSKLIGFSGGACIGERVGKRGQARRKGRAARYAAALPAPARPRIRQDRSGRHRPAYRRQHRAAIWVACAKASPTSRSATTARNGGGKSRPGANGLHMRLPESSGILAPRLVLSAFI